jgi:hypothetical protein
LSEGLLGSVLIAGAGGGVVSTTQVYEAAEPVCEFLTARTWKLCEPCANGPAYVFGLVQAENAAPSKEHWYPSTPPVALKTNVAEV